MLIINSEPYLDILELASQERFDVILSPPLSDLYISSRVDNCFHKNYRPNGLKEKSKSKKGRLAGSGGDESDNIIPDLEKVDEDVRKELKERSNKLAQQVREMSSLLQITTLSQKRELTLEQFMQESLRILINGFSDPRNCVGSMRFRDTVVYAGKYQAGLVNIKRQIFEEDNSIGQIEIANPVLSGPADFHPEERNLVIVASKYLGQILLRKESEIELLKFKELVEQNPNIIIVTNPDGNIRYVNPSFQRVLGYKKGEMIGHLHEFAVSAGENARIYQDLLETLDNRKSWSGELKVFTADKKEIWTYATISPVKKNGDVLHYVAQVENIDQKKKLEEEYQKNLEQYLILVNTMKSGVLIINPKGKIIFRNETAMNDMRFLDEKGKGETVFHMVPRNRAGSLKETLAKIFVEEINYEFEIEHNLGFGARNFEVSIRPLQVGDGKPFAAMVIAHDVTHHKQLEVELQNNKNDLELITDNAPHGIVILDKEMRMIFVNPKICEILESEPENLIGSTPMDFISYEHKELIMERFANRIKNKPLSESIEVKVNTAKGHFKHINIMASSTIWKGQAAYLYNVIDISSKKRTQQWMQFELEIHRLIGYKKNLDTSLRSIFDVLCRIDWIDCGGIYRMNKDNTGIELIFHHNLSDHFVNEVRYYSKDSPQYKSLLEKKAILTKADRISHRPKNLFEAEGLKFVAVLPLLHKDDPIGVINLASRHMDTISEEDGMVLFNIAQSIGHLIALKSS